MAFLISSGKAKSGLMPDQLRLQISEITGYLSSHFLVNFSSSLLPSSSFVALYIFFKSVFKPSYTLGYKLRIIFTLSISRHFHWHFIDYCFIITSIPFITAFFAFFTVLIISYLFSNLHKVYYTIAILYFYLFISIFLSL